MPRVTDGSFLKELLKAGAASGAPTVPTIAAPNSALYGVYGTQNAAAMSAAAANDPYFGPVESIRLNDNANREAAAYEQQLEATRIAQERAQAAGYKHEMGMKYLEKSPDAKLIGTYNYSGVIDPALAMGENAMTINESNADVFDKRTQGLERMNTVGLLPSKEDVAASLRDWNTPLDQVMPYNVYKSPEQLRKEYGTDQGLTADQQFSLQELINRGMLERAQISAAKGAEGDWTTNYSPNGTVVGYTYKGPNRTPEVPNPNAAAPAGGVAATEAGDPKMFFAPSRVTSGLGPRKAPTAGASTNHKGIDYRANLGEPIPAEQDGTVISVGPKKGFGNNVVTVEYADGSQVFYGHNRAASVQPGQKIKAGQKIGEAGSEGKSTGSHVHKQVVRGPQRDVPGTRVAKLNLILTRSQQRGGKITQEGDKFRVTAPDGRSKVYDINGNVVQ